MFSVEQLISEEASMVVEFRDFGEGTIGCTNESGEIRVDGEDYVCDHVVEATTEADHVALAYKTYNARSVYWKFGVGSYTIVYNDSNIPDKRETDLYIGWGIPIDTNTDRSGLYLDFGATIHGTFGLGIAYQFAPN